MIKWGDRAKYIRNLDRPTASHSKQCPPTRKPSQLNEKPIAMSLHTSNLYEFGNHVRFPSYSKFFNMIKCLQNSNRNGSHENISSCVTEICYINSLLMKTDCPPIRALILALHPANESRRYFVTASLIGWTKAWSISPASSDEDVCQLSQTAWTCLTLKNIYIQV